MTGRGWLVLILGGSLLGLGWVDGEPILHAVGGACLILLILAWCWSRFSLRGVRVRRVLDKEFVQGDTGRIVWMARNRRRGRRNILRIWERTRGLEPGRAQAGPTIVESGQTVRLMAPFTARRRGPVRLEMIRVEGGDPLGLCRLRRRFRTPVEVLVLCRSPRFELSVRGESSRTRSFQPFSATIPETDPGRLRAYREGDDLRRIHWLSSARARELIVRPELPGMGRIAILLDGRFSSDCGISPRRAMDTAAALAMGLALAHYRRHHQVGLAILPSHGSQLPPAGTTEHLHQIHLALSLADWAAPDVSPQSLNPDMLRVERLILITTGDPVRAMPALVPSKLRAEVSCFRIGSHTTRMPPSAESRRGSRMNVRWINVWRPLEEQVGVRR